MSSDVLKFLNCCNCNAPYEKPVLICESGHSLCKKCSVNKATCSLCAKFILQTRNLFIEELIDNCKFSCLYEKLGCNKKFRFTGIKQHEISCSFAQVYCPVESCNKPKKYSELLPHCKEKHAIIPASFIHTGFLTVNSQLNTIKLIEVNKDVFVFKIKVVDCQLIVSVRQLSIKNKKPEFSYTYKLCFYKEEKSRQRCILKDNCFITDGLKKDLLNDNYWIGLPIVYLATFLNNKSKINYNLIIIKDGGDLISGLKDEETHASKEEEVLIDIN